MTDVSTQGPAIETILLEERRYPPHPEFAAHLLHLYRLAFVSKGGVTGDDEQAGELGEVAGEVLSDTVVEILLRRVTTEVGERQHDNGRLIGQWQRRRRGEVTVLNRHDPYAR